MSEERVKAVNNDDPTLLYVKGDIRDDSERKAYIKKLSVAIFAVFQKHHKANLRCVGAAALNNATKASILTLGEASKKGVHLAMIPSFQTVTFEGSGEKTAISFEVCRVSFVDN